MFPPVFQKLKASTDVKAIVGTNPPRIYMHGAAPQDTSKPYVTWFIVAGTPENELSATPSIDRYVVQVDCWHTDSRGVRALAAAVREAIEPFAHMVAIPVDSRELDNTKLFRIALEFDWWYEREDVFPAGQLVYVLGLSGDEDGELKLSGDATSGTDKLVLNYG